MLIREVDARNNEGKTPLADAIKHNKPDAVELLIDKGAKITNIHEEVEIPNWVNRLLETRRKVIRANLVFYGVLRKRQKIGKDMSGQVSRFLWSTRFSEEWKE